MMMILKALVIVILIYFIISLYKVLVRAFNYVEPKSSTLLHVSPTIEPTNDLERFSFNQNYLALTLAKHVMSSEEAKDKNLVVSPLSIHVVLGLIASGSTGRTQEEVLEYLKSNSSNDFNSMLSQIVTKVMLTDGLGVGGPKVTFANGVWVDQRFTLKERFKEIVEHVYKAVVDKADFRYQAEMERKKLNLWAEEKTNGLIRDIIPPGAILSLTRIIFGNAIYFKGDWVDKLATEPWAKDFRFSLLDGTSVTATFMTNKKDQYVSVYNGFKVLRLPYKRGGDGRSFSMYIFLPDSRNGLHALVEKVTSKSGFIENHLPRTRIEVDAFWVPKFKICFNFDASKALKELGLVSAFSGGLREIVDEKVSVSTIIHKSVIDVNEEGTEAAAVSFGIAKGCAMRKKERKVVDFVADHPFLFVIREETTGILLFVGHLLNPLLG